MGVRAGPEGRFPPAESGLGLAAELMGRPTVSIPVPTTSASRVLVGGPCILAGVSLRDGGTAEVDVDGSSGNVANAAAVATLPAAGGQTTYITDFEVTAAGSTAALDVVVTVAGVLGGTKSYVFTFPAGVAVVANSLIVEFPRPIPAAAVNTAIVVTLPAGGAGNTNAAVTAHGFQRTSQSGTQQMASNFDLLNGLDGAGELVLTALLDQRQGVLLSPDADGPFCSRGLFLSMFSGTIRGAVWVKL